MLHDVAAAHDQMPFTTDEIDQIESHITKTLGVPERKQFARKLDVLDKIVDHLKSRPFVQVMAGSAAKRPGKKDKPRSFATLNIERLDDGYRFTSERYPWNYQTESFSHDPETESHVFRSAV
jgi:hypothetical protein